MPHASKAFLHLCSFTIIYQRSHWQVSQKDPTTGPPETDCHLILAADVLSRLDTVMLRHLADGLAERGFLLLEEGQRALDEPAARDAIAKAGLIVVSRQVAASCEYLLLRKVPELPEESIVIEVS